MASASDAGSSGTSASGCSPSESERLADSTLSQPLSQSLPSAGFALGAPPQAAAATAAAPGSGAASEAGDHAPAAAPVPAPSMLAPLATAPPAVLPAVAALQQAFSLSQEGSLDGFSDGVPSLPGTPLSRALSGASSPAYTFAAVFDAADTLAAAVDAMASDAEEAHSGVHGSAAAGAGADADDGAGWWPSLFGLLDAADAIRTTCQKARPPASWRTCCVS